MTLSDKRLAPLQELIAEAARDPIAIRWTSARKMVVVEAICSSRLSRDDALTVFGLSDEELRSWEARCLAYGAKGLRATRFQDYRVQPAADHSIDTTG